MIDYTKLSKLDLNSILATAAHSGDIDTIKEVFSTDAIKKCYNTIPKNMMFIAAQRGNLHVIQYMMESVKLLDVISPKFLKYISKKIFKEACIYGQKDVVDYLFHLPQFKIKESFETFEDSLYLVIKNGHLNLIDYFFNLPDPSFAYKSLKNSSILTNAEHHNQLDVVKYIFSNLKVQDKIGIHCDNDIIFKTAHQANLINVLTYLIYDLQLERTEEIDKFLERFPNPEVEKMFLKTTLNSELSINDEKTKKLKL